MVKNKNINIYLAPQSIMKLQTQEENSNLLENKNDILAQIDEENQKLLNSLCHTAEKLEISIDKLNSELISHKDLTAIKKLEKNKHKLLSKITKTINRINFITIELNSIGDLFNSLKLSNCENISRIEKKIKNANNLSPEIIEIIQNYIQKKNINLSIFILSQQ